MVTEPEPGFVPLSERLGEVRALILVDRDEATKHGATHMVRMCDAHLATIDDAIEALQMGEMDSSQDLAPAVSGGREDAPTTAWVVLGSSGQYSDWSQWVVCVCPSEQSAKDKVGELSAATRMHWEAQPAQYDDEDFDAFLDRSEDARKAWAAKVTEIDPDAYEYEQPNYTAREVPTIPPTMAKEPR